MTGRLWTLVAASALAALAACSGSKSSPSAQLPSAFVSLTLSSTAVLANGTNTVTVSFTNSSGGQATIQTSQGTLSVGGASQGTSYATTQAAGTVELVTCVFGQAGCTAATTTVTISAPGTTAVSKTVTFGSLAAACRTDCAADAACANQLCSTGTGTGVCSSGACVSGTACTPTPAGATTETSCTDGVDNDCNGLKDCADTACDGVPCKAGAPSYLCMAKACTDVSTGIALSVFPRRERLPAVANVDADLVVTVAYLGDPVGNVTVTASLSDPSLGTLTPASAMTRPDGVAHFTFRTSGAPGKETITVSYSPAPGVVVTGSANVMIPRLGALQLIPSGVPTPQYLSSQYDVMGAKGSGFQELSWLRVQVIDDVGLPYPDGLPVRFEHQQLGGSTLGLPLAADTASCAAATRCVGYEGVTTSSATLPDSSGVAQAWIYSGTIAGTLSVIASATAAGTTVSVLLPSIAVVGAKPSGNNFSIACSPRNVPALAETDCAISLVDAPFTCEAILKDRYNNVLGRATQVIFMSEAGSVGYVVSTPAYSAASQLTMGRAVQTFQTLGNGLPFDVDPSVTSVVYDASPLTTVQITEPSVEHAADGCGLRTHNPRDGVVTIIAIADGEEAFFDADGNGTFSPGDSFVDLGEPFVDQNDNGRWDPGEWFLDLDGNRTWTGPNGRWDANTKIWTQTFVVYTGTAASFSTAGGWLGTRIVAPSDWVAAGRDACAPTPWMPGFAVTVGPPQTSQDLYLVASDHNLNFLQTQATYGLDATSGVGVTIEYRGLTTYADETGFDWRYWPCVGNVCTSQCRANGACTMRPEFTAFSCGYPTAARVTAASAGSGQVRWNIDVPYSRYGNGVVSHSRSPVDVTVRP